jgi:uncharacterized protein (DUF2236 family)
MAATASDRPVQPQQAGPASAGGCRTARNRRAGSPVPQVTGTDRSHPAGAPADFDVRDVIEGAALLASTANVIMQLARPAVGYGVVESKVETGQVMRHPLRRLRTTITYLSVAFLGTADEREFYGRQVNRAHAHVRSAAGSPVRYNAFDPQLQLWVAACLYRGMIDVRTLLHGPADEAVTDAIYRECRRIGTTLQVPEQMWPADRAAFERYWDAALAEVRIDPPVRDYLDRLMALDYLPCPLSTTFGPVNRFLTAGFLPPPFRAQMQVSWTERDQQLFTVLITLVAAVNRLLPGPVSRFPFNACLQDLRIRRLVRLAEHTPRSPMRP